MTILARTLRALTIEIGATTVILSPTTAVAQMQFRPSLSVEQRLAALEAQNLQLVTQVAQLTAAAAQAKQASDKEAFADRFRLTTIELWENLKTEDDNQNFTALWNSSAQIRAWGDSFYQLYLQHKHSYLDDATAAGRYAVYETSAPYPIKSDAFGPNQLDVLGPGLASVDERFVNSAPTSGPADGRHLSPLPASLPPLKRP